MWRGTVRCSVLHVYPKNVHQPWPLALKYTPQSTQTRPEIHAPKCALQWYSTRGCKCKCKCTRGVLRTALYWWIAQREELENRKIVEEVIEFLQLESIRHELVDGLPIGLKKRVELARALVAEPQMLILDEPMAGMNQEEKGYMSRFILDARAERGVSVLLIEHHMDVITGICDRMLALNYGEMIASGIPKEVVKDPRVIEAYIGGSHD